MQTHWLKRYVITNQLKILHSMIIITMRIKLRFIVLLETKNHSTLYSQVVPHPSTNNANMRLTAEIGRDPVLSHVYGRD